MKRVYVGDGNNMLVRITKAIEEGRIVYHHDERIERHIEAMKRNVKPVYIPNGRKTDVPSFHLLIDEHSVVHDYTKY